MTISLNVTGERFDAIVDTDNATFAFLPPTDLPPVLLLRMWNVVLHIDEFDDVEDLLTRLGHDTQAQNLLLETCELEIQQPCSGEFWVALYDGTGREFLRVEDDSPFVLSRAWRGAATGFEYSIGTILDWPPGNAGLDIIAQGPTMIHVDIDRIRAT